VERGGSAKTACLAWTPDGKGIILRTTQELQSKILPIAASGGKLLSFTRKLYRWGFRQARSKHDNEKIFCHPLFQRDDKTLIVGMKSITAEGTKRALAAKTSIMADEESKLPEQLKTPYPSIEMDYNLHVHDRFRCGANATMAITTHSISRQESMCIPGAPWPPVQFGVHHAHPLHLSPPGVHHLLSSAIHGGKSELDAGMLHNSLGYFQPAPSMQSRNLNIIPLLRPHLFSRPTFIGNTYCQYEDFEEYPGPSEKVIHSFPKYEEVGRVKGGKKEEERGKKETRQTKPK
jgi:hypothetical protein